MSTERLKSAMREEAMAGVPAFSPLLHERIMSGLRAAERTEVARAGNRGWLRYAAALVVMTIGGAAVVWSVYGPRRVTPAVVQMPSPQDIAEPVDRILTSAAAPAVQTMDEARFGYLDHDAKNFVTFLASQFPGTPQPGSSRRSVEQK
jgi:hypothetical protein